MRSREQFKAYVYAKAEAEQARGRKRRRLMFSGIAACSVCICVISAAFLMPHGFNKKMRRWQMARRPLMLLRRMRLMR